MGFVPATSLDIDSVAPVTELHQWIVDRELMHAFIKKHLLRAQGHMKRQAFFQFLWALQDCSEDQRSGLQASPSAKCCGPPSLSCIAIQDCSEDRRVAYKLLLPPSTAVHAVFHV